MSEQWLGLHNPGRHLTDEQGLYCTHCSTADMKAGCHPSEPCKCCLATEIKALQPLRIKNAGLAADNVLLRSQVQKVRDLHKPYEFAPGDLRCAECWSSETDNSPEPWPCATILTIDGGPS